MALIDHDTESVLPEADKIIATAQENASAAVPARMAVAGANPVNHHLDGVGVGAHRLVCSWRIGRSITRPLETLPRR